MIRQYRRSYGLSRALRRRKRGKYGFVERLAVALMTCVARRGGTGSPSLAMKRPGNVTRGMRSLTVIAWDFLARHTFARTLALSHRRRSLPAGPHLAPLPPPPR